jgi:hypothetical protein
MGKNNSGQILLEVLVAMSVAAIVMVLGSQLVYVSLMGNKISGDNNVAAGLTEETFAAVQAAGTENWDDLYSLTRGAAYHPVQSAGKWILAEDAEMITLNGIAYSRSFTAQNICRDNLSRAISGLSDNDGGAAACHGLPGSSHDPSTQKINVIVSWPDGALTSDSEYLTRWRNKICRQTSWSSAGTGVKTCPDASYESADKITAGASLQLTPE